MGARFWLQWSWRDLRKRAPQVVAIATIVALGAGIFAGLGSTSTWRRRSLDASFTRLAAPDVTVALVGGTTATPARLRTAVASSAGVRAAAVETRLLANLPASVRKGDDRIVAAGELVGTDITPAPRIDRWRVVAGRDLRAADDGKDVGLLDAHFAQEHDLPSRGTISVGATTLRYVGLALAPEYLDLNTTSGEAIQGQGTRAVVFAPLASVQRIAVAPHRVNTAVVRLPRGVNARAVARRMERTLATSLPDVALTVTAFRDEPSVHALYAEIDSEQRLFDVFALLILAGAGFAAFNLTKRVVEAQRRDIGIAMSLGVSPRQIAIRPLLFATEITVAGVLLGVGAGWAIGTWVLSVIRERAPLPYWSTPFQFGLFARAALLGLVVPLVSSAFPVWRALRVQPVDALLPPHLRGGGHRLTRLLRRVQLPGTTTVQTPLRRIMRAPARSVLTIAAIAFIMAPLLAAFGATDSATATIDSGDLLLSSPRGDVLLVDLATYQPASSPLVEKLRSSPLVDHASAGLNTGGYLLHAGETLGVSIAMVRLDDPYAAPPSIAKLHLAPGGIVISAKAANDLGLHVGDRVVLRHPRRVGTGFRFVQTELPIRAVHSSPYRFVAYMDLRDEQLMGIDGLVNTMKLTPKPSVSMAQLQQEAAATTGVASALPVSALSRTMRDLLSIVGNLFIILQVIIALLAFLVAFNASNISVDERAREHATMFAFGVRIRRVLGMAVAESLVLGVVGVGLGLGLGVALLRWILDAVFPAAVPDLAVLQSISTSSFLVTVGIALIAVVVAPWLNVRRLRRMNIPSTLRYVE